MISADPAANITELDLIRSRKRSLSFMVARAEQAAHSPAGNRQKPMLGTKMPRSIVAPEATQSDTHKKVLARKIKRRALLISAAAALLAGGLVTAEVIMPAFSGASAEASEFLSNAAAATIKTSDSAVGPGQYLKIETKAVYVAVDHNEKGETNAWLEEHGGQVYVPADLAGEWVWHREVGVATTFFTEAARVQEAALDRDRKPETLRGVEGAFYGTPQMIINGMDVKDAIETLPRDPHQLLGIIYMRTLGSGPSPEIEALVTIADTLRTGVIPADLRAALYNAAALIPGVTIVDRQATLGGRTGIAIGIPGENYRQEIIIDPATGLLIGERTVLLRSTPDIPAFPEGTAISWTSVRTSVVDATP
jgi:RNA polymerase sigma-70 factor (ECF subfamily)